MHKIYIDFLGLFIFVAGFVIGLGAVTVIDLHGFFGRKSSYWTEATIRTHKITKPLIWMGIFLAIFGGAILYRNQSLSGIPMYHATFAAVLLVNGIFLSFYVSPFLLKREQEGKQTELLPSSLQNKIMVSLVISDVCWWGGLVLLIMYIFRHAAF